MKKFFKIAVCFMLILTLSMAVVACSEGDGATGTTGQNIKKSGDVYYVKSYSAEKDENGNTVTTVTVGEKDAYKTADGTMATVTKIGEGAFKNNSTIETLIVKENVTEIGVGAFAGMTKLKKLVLPFVGTKIDAVNTNRLIANLFGTTEFEGGIALEVKSDYRNDSETAVTYYIPSTLNEIVIDYKGTDAYEIPMYSFYFLPVSKITVTGNINKIGIGAFAGSYITEFTVPSTVTEIDDQAFMNCDRLTSITFDTATKITRIGKKAFQSFKGSQITFGEIGMIDEFAFASESEDNLTLLETFTYTSIDSIAINAFEDTNYLTVKPTV